MKKIVQRYQAIDGSGDAGEDQKKLQDIGNTPEPSAQLLAHAPGINTF